MKEKYNLENILLEKKQKRAPHKKIDTTIGQRKFDRANINRAVGAEHAGRIGGLTGEQAFKEILNMSVSRVTTRGGDTQTDLDLNVYPGVMLGGGAMDPWATSDNMFGKKYMYEVVGKPTKTACEIGFSGKSIYVGKFVGNAGWQFIPNSNLDNPDAMKKLIKKANGNSDTFDPKFWTLDPKAATRNRLIRSYPQFFGQPGFFEELIVPKQWKKQEIISLWEAGGDQYFMKLFRKGKIGARLCRSSNAPVRYAILGHKDSLTIKDEKGNPMEKMDFEKKNKPGSSRKVHGKSYMSGGKSYEFNWSILDPQVKIDEVDKDFIYKEIPTINSIVGPTPKSIRWNSKAGGGFDVVLRWENWRWSRCPLLEFTREAIQIMEAAMNAADGSSGSSADFPGAPPIF